MPGALRNCRAVIIQCAVVAMLTILLSLQKLLSVAMLFIIIVLTVTGQFVRRTIRREQCGAENSSQDNSGLILYIKHNGAWVLRSMGATPIQLMTSVGLRRSYRPRRSFSNIGSGQRNVNLR